MANELAQKNFLVEEKLSDSIIFNYTDSPKAMPLLWFQSNAFISTKAKCYVHINFQLTDHWK